MILLFYPTAIQLLIVLAPLVARQKSLKKNWSQKKKNTTGLSLFWACLEAANHTWKDTMFCFLISIAFYSVQKIQKNTKSQQCLDDHYAGKSQTSDQLMSAEMQRCAERLQLRPFAHRWLPWSKIKDQWSIWSENHVLLFWSFLCSFYPILVVAAVFFLLAPSRWQTWRQTVCCLQPPHQSSCRSLSASWQKMGRQSISSSTHHFGTNLATVDSW